MNAVDLSTPGARFGLIESDRRHEVFHLKHNLDRPCFTPVGLCSDADVTTGQAARYPDERQRAGYLALGFLLSAAALVGLQVWLMPSALFGFCALLCFIQLSSRALHWFETNHVARRTLSLWRRLGAFPRLFRLSILALVVMLCTVALAFGSRPFWHFEMAINVLLCAGLLLFVGPQARSEERIIETGNAS